MILDGDPNDKVEVALEPRRFKGRLEELGRIFYDELISAAFHTVQFVRNKEMREALMKSLSTDAGDVDEEDIARIWEDKFGSIGKSDE